MESVLSILSTEAYLTPFHQHGVHVFKQFISSEQIQSLTQEIHQIKQTIFAKINPMPRPLKTYSDIAERELGRLDFRCGFSADIFRQVEKPIIAIVKSISPRIDFRHYWGALTSLGGAGPTDLHRDVYSVLNTSQGNDLASLDMQLPPYYFTVLIPLIDLTHENGPTEFIKGSHLHPVIDESTVQGYAPLLSRGDFVMFDGRTLHRGQANQTKNERLIAYITFVANWYYDQTFVLDEYLFPEW